MPALAADAPPIAAALVFTTGQAMALYLALVFANDAPWLLSSPVASIALLAAGLITTASGGVMAAVQRDLGRLFGYAALSNLGFLLLALVVGGSQARSLALLHTVNRALAITLMATGLAIIRFRAQTDEFSQLSGVARRLPIATIGFLIGGLALAGFPLTAGFPTHWAVNRAIWNSIQPLAFLVQETGDGASASAGDPLVGLLAVLALLASSVGIVVGTLRGLSAMIGPETREELASQPAIASLMVAVLVLVVILLGLYPQAVAGPVLDVVASVIPF
jgi:formate hydrogenlyase subunit 3/multisubunit Na+/H+ antiporter MnhD subunit